MLWMVQRVFFGPLKEPHNNHGHIIRDLKPHEIAALAPLLVFIVWIGVYPKFFLTPISPAVTEILARTDKPLEEYYATNPTGEPRALATGGTRDRSTADKEASIQLTTHSGR
jgi:hypothetical protein